MCRGTAVHRAHTVREGAATALPYAEVLAPDADATVPNKDEIVPPASRAGLRRTRRPLVSST